MKIFMICYVGVIFVLVLFLFFVVDVGFLQCCCGLQFVEGVFMEKFIMKVEVFKDLLECKLFVDMKMSCEVEVMICGEKVLYKVMFGIQLVYGQYGKVVVLLYYIFYECIDVEDDMMWLFFILFNGGFGLGLFWMYFGYMSFKFFQVDDEGYLVQFYGVKDNLYLIFDVVDIVFVNLVNIGFLCIFDLEVDCKMFFGVCVDVWYFVDWFDVFVLCIGCWCFFKYLIGESYGMNCVFGFVGVLQNCYWMYFNGVIFVLLIGFGFDVEGLLLCLFVFKLLYYIVVVYYYGQFEELLQLCELFDVLQEVEIFIIEEYLLMVVKGGFFDDVECCQIVVKVVCYVGLSEQYVFDYNFVVLVLVFWKEFLCDEGFIIGCFDLCYLGVDYENVGECYDYLVELMLWNYVFVLVINYYLCDEFGFEIDFQYYFFGLVYLWEDCDMNVVEELCQVMVQNFYLYVMVQLGYYDGVMDYFMVKYVFWNFDCSGCFQDWMCFEGYCSGYMMYLCFEDFEILNQYICEFIEQLMLVLGVFVSYGLVCECQIFLNLRLDVRRFV